MHSTRRAECSNVGAETMEAGELAAEQDLGKRSAAGSEISCSRQNVSSSSVQRRCVLRRKKVQSSSCLFCARGNYHSMIELEIEGRAAEVNERKVMKM